MCLCSLNPCFNGRYSQSGAAMVVKSSPKLVLILVLMEDTLRENVIERLIKAGASLNPCFNGRYSQRFRSFKKFNLVKGLNPCFNGRYSQSRNGGW